VQDHAFGVEGELMTEICSAEIRMPTTSTGKVYLVGAGPGHPDLLTIRGAELLKTAEVIVYDRLIQDEVLALAKPSAEKIFMGKPLGRHCSRQDEIHDLLVRKAREGKTVVRLKGGDPFLFGRGGEEAEYLAEHGITFEVVPGVSSCLSAPLSAGIAVTHRDRASSVAIVTGHNADGNDDRLDWCALSKVDTLVVLMGVHNAAHIAQRLMAAGRSADTPAAAVQMAFWPGENVVSATLGTIADEVRRAHVEAPATLVIGEVVRLRDKLKHHQQHIGDDAGRDSLIRTIPVPIPDRPSGDTPDLDTLSLDTLSLEAESCPAPCEKEVLQ
jgi:uroporphyrin-III C-methyltransferase